MVCFFCFILFLYENSCSAMRCFRSCSSSLSLNSSSLSSLMSLSSSCCCCSSVSPFPPPPRFNREDDLRTPTTFSTSSVSLSRLFFSFFFFFFFFSSDESSSSSHLFLEDDALRCMCESKSDNPKRRINSSFRITRAFLSFSYSVKKFDFECIAFVVVVILNTLLL